MLTYAAQSEWIWRHYLAVFLVFLMILRRVLVKPVIRKRQNPPNEGIGWEAAWPREDHRRTRR